MSEKDEKIYMKLGVKTEKLAQKILSLAPEIKKGRSTFELLTDEEKIQATLEHYRQLENMPGRVCIMDVGEYTFKEIIELLEQRKEPYKIFIEARCKYLDWLLKNSDIMI